ncbi:centromere protein H [Octopus bimaculoides]|uniref:Centromere protein H C-terminal domain-containing protein n=1 Tax=Octopus bimaculoides TaxID=37653 RepID=A0A0L8GYH5_OCTBM|nr:centromere protein H [Octopus bimaculoides]XP_014776925.1 centromere protein H [Octopus bimaculoides]|eukprot:XP_014776923.1 PREDICTED: centromere protein H-like [Octopus bimaculoides]
MSESSANKVFSEKDKELFNENDLEKLLVIKSSLRNRLKDEKLSEKAEASVLEPEAESKISELIKEVTLQTCRESRRKLMIERLQISQVLIENLFEKDESTDLQVSKELESFLETQRKLSVDILKKHKALTNFQSKVDQMKVENLRNIAQNRELMIFLEPTNQNLKAVVEKYNSKSQESRFLEELAKLKKENRAFQYILQSLIAGSSVDWADDPELLSVMLRAGKEL